MIFIIIISFITHTRTYWKLKWSCNKSRHDSPPPSFREKRHVCEKSDRCMAWQTTKRERFSDGSFHSTLYFSEFSLTPFGFHFVCFFGQMRRSRQGYLPGKLKDFFSYARAHQTKKCLYASRKSWDKSRSDGTRLKPQCRRCNKTLCLLACFFSRHFVISVLLDFLRLNFRHLHSSKQKNFFKAYKLTCASVAFTLGYRLFGYTLAHWIREWLIFLFEIKNCQSVNNLMFETVVIPNESH